MEITNYSVINSVLRYNHNLLPKNLRALIVGKSNSGKSTLLYNLLLKPWLDYDNLLVFGKSLHQKEYQIIKNGFEHGLSKAQIGNIFENQELLLQAGITPFQAIEEYNGLKENSITAKFFEDSEMIPDPSDLNPQAKNLLILDDCFLGKQNKAEAYYTRGRHNNCDTIFLSQNYFRLNRSTIRENCNFLMLFQQDTKNQVWAAKLTFVRIDLTSSNEKIL